MKFSVIIERDEDGMYIGKVPQLKGCVTQGSTIDELMKHMKEAIELYLESSKPETSFVEVKQIEIA